MFAGRPIIGITGGIGSGKSFVARMFGELGCLVLNADGHVREVYRRPAVKEKLRSWWGEAVLDSEGQIDRAFVARIVFDDRQELRRLESLVHPLVGEVRDMEMRNAASNASIRAFVWDVPLLVETGLDRKCDAVVFVECPFEQRLERVGHDRGWDRNEMARREKSQMPLDKKRAVAKYIVRNTAGAAEVRHQVREVLSRILAGTSDGETPEKGPAGPMIGQA